MELTGERVRLRPATPDDAASVLEILEAPGVARWWPGATIEESQELMTRTDVHAFMIEFAGATIGFVQYAEEPDEDYAHAGIDIALHDAWQGRGLGTDALRTLARHLTRDRRIHRLTIDPAAENARAIRCYEKVGFHPVGIMRAYERGADGTWHNGLLMDLLPDDLA